MMEVRIHNLQLDYESGKPVLGLKVNASAEEVNEWIEPLKGEDLTLELKKKSRKRSLDANALYWVLEGKLAKKMEISTSELHNLLLADYGELELMEGRPIEVRIPDTEEAERNVYHATQYHLKPTDYIVTEDGVNLRIYHMMRGSHTYSKEEMSRLINGLIEECKFQGIETMSDKELERALNLWENRDTAS